MENHPLLKVDQTQFAKEFNLGTIAAKVALGIISALVVRAALAKIDAFIGKRKS